MQPHKIYKIAIVGPESTGKSQLAQQLATYYQTDWVEEYARTYLEKNGLNYTYEDVVNIAKGQIKLEDEKINHVKSHLLFFDTNLTVIKIWMENAYQRCDEWVLNTMQQRHYDLHLLTDIDLPWQPDPMREHPHLRSFFLDWYKKELTEQGVLFSVVSGKGEERLKNAIQAIESFLSS